MYLLPIDALLPVYEALALYVLDLVSDLLASPLRQVLFLFPDDVGDAPSDYTVCKFVEFYKFMGPLTTTV